jgi:hypothetical protein
VPEGSDTVAPVDSPSQRAGAYLAAVYLFVMLVTGLGVKGVIGCKSLRHLEIPFTVAVLVVGVAVGIAYQVRPRNKNDKMETN